MSQRKSSASVVLVLLFIQIICHEVQSISEGIAGVEVPSASDNAIDDSNRYFAINDNLQIVYHNDQEKHDIVENIRQIWEQLLGPLAVNVKMIVWKELVTTSSAGVSTDLLSYVISGAAINASTDVQAILLQFHHSIEERKLGSVVVGRETTSESTIKNANPNGTGTSVLSFSFVDSVWMTYKPLNESDELLAQLEASWKNVLVPTWNSSRVLVALVQRVPNQKDEDNKAVKVIYVVVGESVTLMNTDQAKLKFRQSLADAHIPGLWGTPFQWSSHVHIAISNPQNANKAEIPVSLTCSVLNDTINLAYATEQEKIYGLRTITKLWSFIFNSSLEEVNANVISTERLPADGPISNDKYFYRLVVEVVKTNPTTGSGSCDELTQRFHRLLDLSSLSYDVDVAAVAGNGNNGLVPTSIGSDTWIIAHEIQIIPESTDVNGTWEINTCHVFLLYDSITVTNISQGDLGNLSGALNDAWKEALGSDALTVQIAVSSREYFGPQQMRLSYMLIALSKNLTLHVNNAKPEVHHALQNSTMLPWVLSDNAAGPAKTSILENVKGNTKNFVLFDTVQLAYGTDKAPDTAVLILGDLWRQTLGNDAWNCNVSVYHARNAVSFSLAGDSGLPINKLSFRVTFQANTSNWDLVHLKAKYRQLLPSARNASFYASATEYVPQATSTAIPTTTATTSASTQVKTDVNGQIYLSTTLKPTDGTIIQDTVLLTYPNETERNQCLALLRKVWADALHQDVFDVRLSVSRDDVISNTSTNNSQVVHQVSYIVIPPTNRHLDVADAKVNFTHVLNNSTVASCLFQSGTLGDATLSARTDETDATNQIWRLFQENATKQVRSFVVYETTKVNASSNQTSLDTLLDSVNAEWTRALNDSHARIFVSLLGVETIASDTSNSSGVGEKLIHYGIAIITDNLNWTINNYSALSSSAKEYSGKAPLRSFFVVVGSLEVVYGNVEGRDYILRKIEQLWTWATGSNSTVETDLYEEAHSSSRSLSEDLPVNYMSYVVRIANNQTRLDVNNTKLRFTELMRNFSYSMHILNDSFTYQIRRERSHPGFPPTTALPPLSTPANEVTVSRDLLIKDSISLQYSDKKDRDTALEEMRKLWALAFKLPSCNVKLLLESESFIASGPDGPVYRLVYTIADLSRCSRLDPVRAKRKFHRFLNNAYGTFVATGEDFDNVTFSSAVTLSGLSSSTTVKGLGWNSETSKQQESPTTHTYDPFSTTAATATSRSDTDDPLLDLQQLDFHTCILYDQLRLFYGNKTDRHIAFAAFTALWKDILGSQATFVRLAPYEEIPAYVNDSVSGGMTHSISYVILAIASNATGFECSSSAKDTFRRRVQNDNLPYIINFAQIYPAPKPAPVKAFAVVVPSPWGKANISRESDVNGAIKKLYELSLGNDLQLVNVWNYVENMSADGNNFTIETSETQGAKVVLLVTNNTDLDTGIIQHGFRNLLLLTSVAAVQSTHMARTNVYLGNITVPESLPIIVFRYDVCFGSSNDWDVDQVMAQVGQLWSKLLSPGVVNVTARIEHSSDGPKESERKECTKLHYIVQGTLLNTVYDLEAIKTKFIKESESFRATLASPAPTTFSGRVLFP